MSSVGDFVNKINAATRAGFTHEQSMSLIMSKPLSPKETKAAITAIKDLYKLEDQAIISQAVGDKVILVVEESAVRKLLAAARQTEPHAKEIHAWAERQQIQAKPSPGMQVPRDMIMNPAQSSKAREIEHKLHQEEDVTSLDYFHKDLSQAEALDLIKYGEVLIRPSTHEGSFQIIYLQKRPKHRMPGQQPKPITPLTYEVRKDKEGWRRDKESYVYPTLDELTKGYAKLTKEMIEERQKSTKAAAATEIGKLDYFHDLDRAKTEKLIRPGEIALRTCSLTSAHGCFAITSMREGEAPETDLIKKDRTGWRIYAVNKEDNKPIPMEKDKPGYPTIEELVKKEFAACPTKLTRAMIEERQKGSV